MAHKVYSFDNLSIRDQFIVGQMALDEIPINVQKFYLKVLDHLNKEFATTKALAVMTCYSDRTVTNYMRLLQKKGYVVRFNYRSWALGNEHQEDGFVLRYNNVFGKCAMREGCRL